MQYILDTVIDELVKDKEKKFIYVEIAFFIRWWREQTQERQDQVGGDNRMLCVVIWYYSHSLRYESWYATSSWSSSMLDGA